MASNIRFTLMTAVAVVVAAPAAAQTTKLVVTRGPYEVRFEDSATDEKARAVAEAVLSAAESKEGFEVILIDDLCETVSCLTQVAKAAEAERAVFVSVTENVGHYGFSLRFLDTTIEGEWTGSFSEVVERIKDLTATSLAEAASKPEVAPALQDENADKTPESEAQPAQMTVTSDNGNRPIKKKGFFIGAATVTAATLVGFIVTESLAQSSWKKLESDNWDSQDLWEEERDRYDNLQLSSRVLLLSTVVFATTSLILGLKTDFSTDNPVALTLTEGGGILSMSGRF